MKSMSGTSEASTTDLCLKFGEDSVDSAQCLQPAAVAWKRKAGIVHSPRHVASTKFATLLQGGDHVDGMTCERSFNLFKSTFFSADILFS
jgi:hypothetical protein